MLKRALSGLLFYVVFGGLLAHAGQFLEAPQYPTGANPQAVATGDFRHDGNLDVVVANSGNPGGNTISVLLSNGDGTFQAQAVYATDTAPEGIAVGDFNNDGYVDIAVTNSGSNTVSIFLNKADGSGTFLPKIDTATGKQPQGVALGDFNGDGNLDLAVTNASDGTVGVLLGKGNGSFDAQVPYTTGFNPWSLAVGCVHAKLGTSGCSVMDLVVVNKNNNNVISVLLGNGDGTFKTQLQSPTGSTPVSVALADFNGDGYLDIAVADQAGNAVSVMLGTGTGSFPTHVEYPTAAFPTGVAVGDFNNDGNMDLAVSAGNGNTVSVLWGQGNGTFEGQVNAGTGDIPYSVVVGDFNNDGTTDLLAANSGGNSVSVILSNGNETFQTRTDFAAGVTPRAVATADFNGDGFPDLVVTNSNCTNFPSCGPSTISILLGNGDGTFQGPASYSTGADTYPYFVVVGDFNGDGIQDLAVANYATNTISVFLGNGSGRVGDGTFQAHIDTSTGGEEPTSIAIGDFNGDGFLDVAVTNFHTNNVSVLLGNNNGTFTPAKGSPYAAGNGPISVTTGKFSGGQIDLVVVNETDNTAGVLLGNGDGTFQPQTPQTTYSTGSGGNPLSVVTGAFSNGGSLDLAVADFLTQEVSVLLGNGDGTFQAVKYYATGNANPSSIVFADFNGDGNLDLALTSTPLGSAPGNLVSLLFGNGNGTFQAATPATLFGTGSEAYSAVVGDFNGDGAQDLAVANGVSNTVSVLLNTQGTAMSLVSSDKNSSFGQSVALTTTVAASVSNGMGAPAGNVKVMMGSTTLGSGNLANGQYSVNTSILPVGSNTLSAVYTSSNGYQSHTVGLIQTVQKAGSSTALASSATSSTLNQLVTFTATVTPSTSGQPTGTVTFSDGTTLLGGPALIGGVASLAISTLAIGTHNITAAYSGDGNFNPSGSGVVSVVVAAAPAPNFSLSSSPASLSVAAGASGQSTITINPVGGLNPSTVALTCSISTTLSPAPTCSLGAISVANSAGSSVLTISTTGPQAALSPAGDQGPGWLFAVGLLLPAILLSSAGVNTANRRKLLSLCLIFLALSGCLLQVACGGSGSNNTPPPTTKTTPSTPAGTYTVTVMGNASGEQHTTSVSLTVQ